MHKVIARGLVGCACLLSLAPDDPVLAQASSDTLTITLLGTGDPVPRTDRFGPSTLIEAGSQKLLVDVGRGATVRLRQLQIPLGEIDGVLLTHFHSDHLTGLSDLWLTGWLRPEWGQRDVPLAIWGPEGTGEFAAGLEQAYSRNIDIRVADENLSRDAVALVVNEYEGAGLIYARDGLSITAFEVDHGELIKPSFGYRIDYEGRTAVISGDTRFDERIIEASRGADVVIHELIGADDSLFEKYPPLERVRSHHTLPEEAGRIFDDIGPKLAVYTHLVMLSAADVPEISLAEIVRRTRQTYTGPLIIGEDLMTFEIAEDVAIYVR